jgi:leucyl aminopeptidase
VLTAPGESSRFKNEGKPPPLATVTLLGVPPTVEAAIKRVTALARGTLYARYLVEAPPNVCSPTYLAGAARVIADAHQATMKLTVLERQQCEDLGMGCFLGVAQVCCLDCQFDVSLRLLRLLFALV